MKKLYLISIILISNLWGGELVNSKEFKEKEKSGKEKELIKTSNLSKSNNILENVPKLDLDLIRSKVTSNKDIFSYKNIQLNKSKINLHEFKLIGLVEIKGIKSILISTLGEIKSFKEGDIIDKKYKIKGISFKPAYVIFQKNKDIQKIYLNK
tara:strand:+ start:249 stop:707 length:459 start_codon:yes stop_codon:yes gene_type:complete